MNASTLPPPVADERFAALVDARRYPAAAEHAAAALGARLAVWWGAMVVWRGIDPEDLVAAAAVDAAVAWVVDPSEANRRTAERAGGAAGVSTPAGALALAAFWAEGSVSLPGQPEVLPPPGVAERLAVGAVQMAAAGPPPIAAANLRQALRLAAELLAGENHPPAPEEDP